jgi:hypothetical protein
MIERSHDLIGALARDLGPVRVIPPIRLGLAGALAAWSLVFVASAWLHEPAVDLAARLSGDGTWTAIALGLGLAALAGCMAGLAAVVPGRDETERRARRVAVGGIALALLVAVHATASAPAGSGAPRLQDLSCFALGASIGLVPLAALLAYARRGHVLRPDRAAAQLLVGGFALGAVTVQVICHNDGARHMLLGHASIPVLLLMLGVLPLSTRLPPRQRQDASPTC